MSANKIDYITLNKSKISDFAGERNLLLKKSRSEWVFFLDNDEIISKALKKEIGKLSDTGYFAKSNGYYVNRKNYFLGRYAGTDKILRLARRDSGKWERRVHETWKVKGNIGELKAPLIHNTADSVSEMLAKINNYSSLHAQANFEEGKGSNMFKICIFPLLKFIQSMAMGRGVVFSILQAFHSFLSWTKLWIYQNA